VITKGIVKGEKMSISHVQLLNVVAVSSHAVSTYSIRLFVFLVIGNAIRLSTVRTELMRETHAHIVRVNRMITYVLIMEVLFAFLSQRNVMVTSIVEMNQMKKIAILTVPHVNSMNFDALMDQNVSMRPRNAIIGTIAEKVTVLMNRTVIFRPVMRDSSGVLMLSAFLPDGDVMDIQIVRTAQMRPIAP
jgi:hypothetical protein